MLGHHRACLWLLPVTRVSCSRPMTDHTMPTRRVIPALKDTFNPQDFSWPGWRWKDDRAIPEKSENFQSGRLAETVFYHSKRQGQDHGHIRTRQGSGRRHFEQGQFFGEGCLDGAKFRGATTTDGRVPHHSITKDRNACDSRQRAEVLGVLLGYLLARNSRIEDDLIDQLFNSSERRLARLLLLLANFGKEGGRA